MANSTFSGNSANSGGALSGLVATTTLANTIVANSLSGGNCDSRFTTVIDGGGNEDDGTTCGFGAGSLSNSNSLLSLLADNGGPTQTMTLQPGSPAIDFTTCLQATDQRGSPRPDASEAKCDSGASESSYDDDLALTNVPISITTNATSPAGTVVTYTLPRAVDEAGDSSLPTVACTPASGSTFPIGTTTVTCTASDSDDMPGTVNASFTVTVKGAVSQIQDLIGVISSFNTVRGLQASLDAQLQGVLAGMQANRTRQACSKLSAFVHLVQAQSGNMLTTAQAGQLLAAANNILQTLGC